MNPKQIEYLVAFFCGASLALIGFIFLYRKHFITLPKLEPITTVLEAAPADTRDNMQVRLVRIHATFGAIRERALQINDLTILRCCNDVIDDAYFLMQEFDALSNALEICQEDERQRGKPKS